MAEAQGKSPTALGGPLHGQDPGAHPIFGMQSYTPGLRLATGAIQHAPELYQMGKTAVDLFQKYRNMGKGYNDDPVGQNVGSDGGRPVLTGPANEGTIDAKSWNIPTPASSSGGAGSGLATLAEDI